MSRFAYLLLTLLACCMLAACERPAWNKDKDMDIVHFGAFKVDLRIEFPDPEHRDLVNAVLDGTVVGWNPAPVQALIDKPGETYHLTPLILAIRNKQYESARWLLRQGANPSYRIPDIKPADRDNPLGGRSPLHYAVNLGNLELATLLFDFGADPNLKGLVDPIFFETMDIGRGDGPLFRLFIERGADIDLRQGPMDTSVLAYAVTRGHCKAALRLIELGADVHARTRMRLGGKFRDKPAEDDWMYINEMGAALNGIDLEETHNEGRCYARLKRKLIEKGVRFPQFDARFILTWLRDKTPITETLLRTHGADDDTVRRVLKWYDEEVMPPQPYRQIDDWIHDRIPFNEAMLREIGANDEQVRSALEWQEIMKLPEHERWKHPPSAP